MVVGPLSFTRWASGQSQAPLLPDLRTLPPSDLHLDVWDNGRHKAIHFSNAIWNDGAADLIIKGKFDRVKQTVDVSQVIQYTDGTQTEAAIGDLIFHAVHDHWHWEGFALYEIWSVQPGGALGEVEASSGKVSFCLRDDERAPGSLDQDQVIDLPRYTGCGWQEQGLSIGWLDIYDRHTPGQTIDISHLPDGIHALASTSNPEAMLQELDTSNNRAITYFRMEGRSLTVMTIVRELADRYARNGVLRDSGIVDSGQ